MYFENVIGNKKIQKLLIKEFYLNRVPHAQLFVGPEDCFQLPMAIAFSSYLFCKNRDEEDACGHCSDCKKMSKLIHPDLHFFFPTIKTEKEEKLSKSKTSFPVFQKALLINPNLNIHDWQLYLKTENKTLGIRTRDVLEIKSISNLKSYEGGYKVFIVWGAETMNQRASNTFLKSLEEPGEKTIFILISNTPPDLLPTIQSRLQIKRFKKMETETLLNHFKKRNPDLKDETILNYISKYSKNYNKIKLGIDNELHTNSLDDMFVFWIRLCFLAVTPKSKLKNPETQKKDYVMPLLINWCKNIGEQERHMQLEFIKIAIEIFRKAFLFNYNASFVKYDLFKDTDFSLDNFSKYINQNNIVNIVDLLNIAYYSLSRYANSKLLFLDLSFNLGGFLQKN